jgi:hypothetical protein
VSIAGGHVLGFSFVLRNVKKLRTGYLVFPYVGAFDIYFFPRCGIFNLQSASKRGFHCCIVENPVENVYNLPV